MILSKDDLSFAFNCARQYFYDSLNSDYPRKDDQKNWELSHLLEQEADNDALEIEGYERVPAWVRFDPNDPKTFPPESTRVQVFDKESEDILTAKYDYDSNEWSLSWCMITHWRPLPVPPVETEEGK